MSRRKVEYQNFARVSIIWQQTSEMYAFKFDYLHFDKDNTCGCPAHLLMKVVKAIPYGSDRDYDPETYTWFFTEKYLDSVLSAIDALKIHFNLELFRKPEPQSFVPKYPDIKKVKTDFCLLAGVNPDNAEYKEAKKAFFKASMRLHPDKQNHNPDDFYLLNTAWQELEIQHYKTKQRVTELKGEEVETYG